MSAAVIDRKRLFGVTHAADGERIQRQVRILKVGIGMLSLGPDVHVYITPDPKEGKPWCVEVGSYQGRTRSASTQTFATRAEAEVFYNTARKGAAKCLAPRRLPYFTFSRQGMDGYIHDFDAIELHGPMPNEIDVVFLSDDPFDANFAMYSASELKCEGDGINARRKLSMAAPEQQPLVEIARRKGEKYFPIVEGCYTKGCPYPKEGLCKPHARLYFQLSNSLFLRVGGTCSFDTTGFRSIAQLDSCIDTIKTITGQGDPSRGMLAGIPLKLVLRPYKTSYTDNQGQTRSSTQFATSLEYRAKSAVELGRLLIQTGQAFRESLQLPESREPLRLQPAPSDILVEAEELEPVALTEEQLTADAAAISAEFYSSEEGQGDGYDSGGDPVEQERESPAAQMPRRKSEASAQPTQSQQPAAAPLVIAGVTFPEPVLAEDESQQMSLDTNTLLSDEAQRIGVPLLTYCDSLLGLRPRELTEGAGQALLQVMRQAPSRKK